MSKFEKKYEWVGDVDSYKEPEPNQHSVKYNEPDRDYDSGLRFKCGVGCWIQIWIWIH